MLRYVCLRSRDGQFVEFSALGNAARFAGSVFRTMALIVLTTICSLACLFLLFVLYQWIRETKRKTTTRSAVGNEADETQETKHPYIVGARKAVERRDRSGVRSQRADAATEPLGGREPTTSASGSPTGGSRDRSNPEREARREECGFSNGRNLCR